MSRPCPRALMRALYVLAGLAIVAASPAAQQTPPETPFRYERPVQTGGAGPRRLAIDVPLLVGGRPFRGRVMPGAGLTDLRFFDSNGQELQYLLVSNPPEQPVWRSARTLAVAAVETPTLKTSGFEIDLDCHRSLPRGRDHRPLSQADPTRRQRRPHSMDAARR